LKKIYMRVRRMRGLRNVEINSKALVFIVVTETRLFCSEAASRLESLISLRALRRSRQWFVYSRDKSLAAEPVFSKVLARKFQGQWCWRRGVELNNVQIRTVSCRQSSLIGVQHTTFAPQNILSHDEGRVLAPHSTSQPLYQSKENWSWDRGSR